MYVQLWNSKMTICFVFTETTADSQHYRGVLSITFYYQLISSHKWLLSLQQCTSMLHSPRQWRHRLPIRALATYSIPHNHCQHMCIPIQWLLPPGRTSPLWYRSIAWAQRRQGCMLHIPSVPIRPVHINTLLRFMLVVKLIARYCTCIPIYYELF